MHQEGKQYRAVKGSTAVKGNFFPFAFSSPQIGKASDTIDISWVRLIVFMSVQCSWNTWHLSRDSPKVHWRYFFQNFQEAAICHILKWKINSVTPLQFLLLYLQSPTVISTKPSMPNFNSILLFYSSTVLDITRLDSHSYIYPFHIISAAIIIRVRNYKMLIIL